MKYFRIFFKEKEDPTTTKSIKHIETCLADFKSAVEHAFVTAEQENLRVVMIAELPK